MIAVRYLLLLPCIIDIRYLNSVFSYQDKVIKNQLTTAKVVIIFCVNYKKPLIYHFFVSRLSRLSILNWPSYTIWLTMVLFNKSFSRFDS